MNGTYWSNISRCSLLPVCRHLTTLQARQAVHRRLELTSPSASTFLKARPAVSSNGNPARSGRSNRLILCLGSKQVSANKTGLSQPTGRGLPVALLITAVACQAFGVRHSIRTAQALLLLLDVAYAGLHLHPLLPLFQRHGKPDMAFMQSYTRPVYFVSECWLLAWLLQTHAIQAKVPIAVLAGHGAVHVLFVILAGFAAEWAMQQQVQRIQNGWNVAGLRGIWHTSVNLVNFADLALHCWYISILWQSIAESADSVSSLSGLLPTGIVLAGLLASYTAATLLPHWMHAEGMK